MLVCSASLRFVLAYRIEREQLTVAINIILALFFRTRTGMDMGKGVWGCGCLP